MPGLVLTRNHHEVKQTTPMTWAFPIRSKQDLCPSLNSQLSNRAKKVFQVLKMMLIAWDHP